MECDICWNMCSRSEDERQAEKDMHSYVRANWGLVSYNPAWHIKCNSSCVMKYKLQNIQYKKDGDKICATYEDFINLQESPAWFWDTEEEAKNNLIKN